VDVEVRVPSRSETTSLRGGWLLETRLKELAVLDRQVHDGHVLALAEGPILVDPSAQPDKARVATCRGRILGGAVVLKSRILGLVLTPGNQTVGNSARVATVVNNRFHTVQKSIQVGVAKAKTDQLIELTIHPRYKDNVDRYVQVVRAIAMKENSAERMARIERLQRELLDPLTAGAAARQLEALGRDGVESLRKGLEASDREVRFFAAEALAYLARREAAAPLAAMARQAPAVRVVALGALGALGACHAESPPVGRPLRAPTAFQPAVGAERRPEHHDHLDRFRRGGGEQVRGRPGGSETHRVDQRG